MSISPFVRVIVSCEGLEATCTALLDSGSEPTLITKALAAVLELKSQASATRLRSFHGRDPQTLVRRVSFQILSLDRKSVFTVRSAYIVEELKVRDQFIDWPIMKSNWRHLADLPIEPHDPANVSLLIGVNVPGALRQLDARIPREEFEPYGILTPFGWTIMGELNKPALKKVHVNILTSAGEDETSWLKDKFSGLEKKTIKAREAEEALHILRSTIRLRNGHYETALLFKTSSSPLPDNRRSAIQSMFANEARAEKDPAFREKLINAVEMYEKEGFSRKLLKSELQGPVGRTWYLPYLMVTHPLKPEKLRLVFDASRKFNGAALNDNLHTQPDLLTSLFSVITRFRENPVAVSMDITKMFLQVGVREEDQAALRYVYRRPGTSSAPQTYQMMVQIFGAASSMSSCVYALRQTALDNPEFSDVANKIIECFYVDNYLDSYRDPKTAVETCSRLVELLAKGGFALSQLISSSKDVINGLQAGLKSEVTLDFLSSTKENRILGNQWDSQSDHFIFSLSLPPRPTTKRQLLRAIARVFDPIGFLTPVMIPLRILMQDVWRLERNTGQHSKEKNWERTLAPEILARWDKITRDWPHLNTLRIPRCLIPEYSPDTNIQLHVFCDASKDAAGAVAYLRVSSKDSVTVSFVAAKSQVAPLDPETIPQAELRAARIGAALELKIRNSLKTKIDTTFFWVDSQSVLFWLRSKDRRKQPRYVSASRDLILKTSLPSQWLYVPSALNSADDISRGLGAATLKESHRFLRGPDFLWQQENQWPLQPVEVSWETEESEAFVNVAVERSSILTAIVEESTLPALLERVSIELFGNGAPRTSSHLHSALLSCVKAVQLFHFQEELNCLTRGRAISRSSRLRKLSPYLDSNQIIRVGGRLDRAKHLHFESRHPPILSANGNFTKLIVENSHIKVLHSTVNRTHYEVRAAYWILRGKQTVRRILSSCSECKRRRAPAQQPMMASLPSARVDAFLPVFFNTGVDYMGPFYVTVKRSTEKRWICLFTCLNTRAIHLELSHDMSASSFLNAFSSFSATRGQPVNVYSDNGTNLIAGGKELLDGRTRVLQDPTTISELAGKGVTWHLNPPAAPHMGGAWESLVKSVKIAIYAAVGERKVHEETLRAALAAATSLVNNRPLTHLGVDPRDERPLTPNHFLIGRENRNLPPDVFESAKGDLDRDRWIAAQQLIDLFWHRWLREYLPDLMERQKWLKHTRNAKVGDIVLIVDRQAPRGQWATGKICEIFLGADGVVRSALVKVGAKTFRRPVAGLCLLEIASKEARSCPAAK